MHSLEVKFDEHVRASTPTPPHEHVKFAYEETIDSIDGSVQNYKEELKYDNQNHHQQEYYTPQRSLSPFSYNKRMTGKKNLSNIIVGSDNKIEFDQIEDNGFGVVKINRPIGSHGSRTFENLYDSDSVHSRDSTTLRDSHTADGFFDLKFYSHPLW